METGSRGSVSTGFLVFAEGRGRGASLCPSVCVGLVRTRHIHSILASASLRRFYKHGYIFIYFGNTCLYQTLAFFSLSLASTDYTYTVGFNTVEKCHLEIDLEL